VIDTPGIQTELMAETEKMENCIGQAFQQSCKWQFAEAAPLKVRRFQFERKRMVYFREHIYEVFFSYPMS
jgi:hypothetical protein